MSSSISLQKPSHELKKTPHLKRFFLLYLFVFIIVLSVLGSFWVSGNMFYDRYVNFIKQFNKVTGQSIQITEYKKGLFHSSAKLLIAIKTGEPLLPNPGFVIDQTISHGPLVFDTANNAYKLAVGAIQSNVSFYFDSTTNPSRNFECLTIFSLFTFGNEYINYFNTLPVNYSWPVSVKWQGLSGNVNFSLKNGQITRVTTQSSSTPLSIAYGPNLFTLSGLNTESDMTYNTLKLWDGSQGLSISEANLTSDNLKYSLYNFHHSSHFITQMPNDYNFTSQWNISQIVVPDLSVNSIQLDLSILNMNAKAFAELITFSRVLKNTNSSDEMIPYLLNIISPKTTLNLNFSSDTSFGDMHFGNVTLKQKIDWPANIPLPKTPEELTKNIHIHADMIVPINLVEYFFTKHFDKMPPPAVSSEPTTEGPSLGNLQNKLEQLQNNNVISTSTKIQIINILKTNPTSDGFAYFLDQLVVTNSIPKDVAESLKAQYQQIEKMTKNTAGINNSAPILPAEPKQAPTSRELALELINSYKNMGYLVQQGDNYLITVDFENEELKINGKTQIIPPTGQPEASQSVANQPVESQPAGQPMTNQPVANQPAASQPAAGGQSMPNQPAANQPVVSEPVTNQPMANQPVENQPATNNPVASQPAVNISH